MNRTLKNCIIVAVCCFLVITVGAVILLNYDGKKDEAPTAVTEVQHLYTLTEYGGRIALYKKGFSMPVEIYDINISSLPLSDRELIKNGINAESDDEIQKVIEDYTS